jgi:tRNA (mo5U34)-methyltransferase
MSRLPSPAEAEQFLSSVEIPWHQRFQLAPGVYTPGQNDVDRLLRLARVREDLSGLTVLDVGASNGGFSFEAERRGATRVLAVDLPAVDYCGIDALRGLLDSRIEYLQASIYELPELVEEQFDLVFFFGVLYHLRHPLLALDNLRRLTHGRVLIETAVADAELGRRLSRRALARFYAGAELGDDPSNWFAPTVRALLDWCRSSGLEPTLLAQWPPGRIVQGLFGREETELWWKAARRAEGAARRCVIEAVPAEPDLRETSWAEWGLSVKRSGVQ